MKASIKQDLKTLHSIITNVSNKVNAQSQQVMIIEHNINKMLLNSKLEDIKQRSYKGREKMPVHLDKS